MAARGSGKSSDSPATRSIWPAPTSSIAASIIPRGRTDSRISVRQRIVGSPDSDEVSICLCIERATDRPTKVPSTSPPQSTRHFDLRRLPRRNQRRGRAGVGKGLLSGPVGNGVGTHRTSTEERMAGANRHARGRNRAVAVGVALKPANVARGGRQLPWRRRLRLRIRISPTIILCGRDTQAGCRQRQRQDLSTTVAHHDTKKGMQHGKTDRRSTPRKKQIP